eukprot:jgi/Botrbrau1/19522/Bobra.0035s0021.1
MFVALRQSVFSQVRGLQYPARNPFLDVSLANVSGYKRSATEIVRSFNRGISQRLPVNMATNGEVVLPHDVVAAVESIHRSNVKTVVYVTGGGMQAVSWLLMVPGGSNTMLEVRVPYGGIPAISQVLQTVPPSLASEEAARDLSRSAYQQAAQLTPFGAELVGIGCTCALATLRSRRGQDKVHVAWHAGTRGGAANVILEKGARDRIEEDAIASRLLLRALGCAAAAPTASHLPPFLSPPVQELQEETWELTDPIQELLEGRVNTLEFSGGTVVVDAARKNRLYLPGSFNPLHDGHRGMLAAACTVAGVLPTEACYELAVTNADKGQLAGEEVARRVAPFVSMNLPLVLTKVPLFTQKALLFPGSTFVVGYDTAIRLVMPKYYGGEVPMLLEFERLKALGCKFLVAGRVGSDGQFMTMADVELPPSLQGVFEAIPEDVFRNDISSTELRRKAAASPAS